jgi:hypothetical protein
MQVVQLSEELQKFLHVGEECVGMFAVLAREYREPALNITSQKVANCPSDQGNEDSLVCLTQTQGELALCREQLAQSQEELAGMKVTPVGLQQLKASYTSS